MRLLLISIKFILIAILFAGCSLEAQIEDLAAQLPKIFSKQVTDEIVAGSQQGIVTTDGYRVQSSVSYYAAPATVKTSQQYKVETSVQSSLYGEGAP